MRAFVVDVPAGEVDLASDVLWQLGVRAIEERPHDQGDAGDRVELWTSVGDDDSAVERAGVAIAGRWEWRTVEVDDTAAATWRDHAGPMRIDDALVVVPAWQELEHDGPPGDEAMIVPIEPAAAFGMGDHPTTRLCLRAITRYFRAVERPDGGPDAVAVLDVGCGTGILAVVAARLGAHRVRAVDVSSAAIDATRANAALNGVAGVVEADLTPAADLPGTYDLVVANILAPELISLASDLRRLTGPRATLVISGILQQSYTHVVDALAPMIVDGSEVDGEWIAVRLRHPPEEQTAVNVS
jgi:ribosomal protein L11 methyltransferase